MPDRLVDRVPVVPPERLIAGLVPPPLFSGVSFDSYRPDPAEPSQAAAVAAVQEFAQSLRRPPEGSSRWRRGRRTSSSGRGLYLDGGFGVGKTHLLAALWQAVPGPRPTRPSSS